MVSSGLAEVEEADLVMEIAGAGAAFTVTV
jgi:hypothetical protein